MHKRLSKGEIRARRTEEEGERTEEGKVSSPLKRRRCRKEANSPRSIFFKSLYRDKEEQKVFANRSDRRHGAKLSVRGSRVTKKCREFSNLSGNGQSRAGGGKGKKWRMNRVLMKNDSPFRLRVFTLTCPSRNLLIGSIYAEEVSATFSSANNSFKSAPFSFR